MGWPSLRTPKPLILFPLAVGLPTSTVASQSLSAFAVLLDGQVIDAAPDDGVIVTLKLQLSPVAAVAVTTVSPSGKKQSLQWLTVITPHSVLPAGGEK